MTTTKIVWRVSLAVAMATAPACVATVSSVGPYVMVMATQREIQKAADRGYRLAPLPGSPWMGGLCLQKVDSPDPVEYLVLSAQRTGTMVREMNEAGAKGFRFASGGPVRAVMQRNNGITTGDYEYGILAAALLETLEGELRVEAAKGFHVVEASLTGHTLMGGDQFFLVLERPGPAKGIDARQYRILSTARATTFELELQQAADEGYRLNPRLELKPGGALVEKRADVVEPLEYRVLSTSHTGTLQAELNSASTEGYRFAAVFSGVLSGALRGSQLAVIMQRKKGSVTRTHEHVLMATSRFATMQRELPLELAKGFQLVGQTTFDPPGVLGVTPVEYVAILERGIQ